MIVGAISATPIVHWHDLQLRRLHLEALKVSQSQHSEALHHGLSQHQVGVGGTKKTKTDWMELVPCALYLYMIYGLNMVYI